MRTFRHSQHNFFHFKSWSKLERKILKYDFLFSLPAGIIKYRKLKVSETVYANII